MNAERSAMFSFLVAIVGYSSTPSSFSSSSSSYSFSSRKTNLNSNNDHINYIVEIRYKDRLQVLY